MDSQRLWALLETVGSEDVYQFLGVQRDASLDSLQSAAASRYASIHDQSDGNDEMSRASLELVGLCISDIFRDANSKEKYDGEILTRTGVERRRSRPSLSGPVAVGVLVVVALGLAAFVVAILPVLSRSVDEAAESERGPEAESNLSVKTAEQEQVSADLGTSRQNPVEVADAATPRPTSANLAPSTTEAGRPGTPAKRTTASRQSERASSGRVVSPSESVQHPAAIEKRAGALNVRTLPASVIELDGEEVGMTGANGFLVLSEVQPGRHIVVARKPGHSEASSVVEVDEGRAALVELLLESLPGRLTVTANVSDARVRIGDGGEHSLPLTALEVPAGSYRVTASRDGFRTVTNDVEIRPGALGTLDFVLEQLPVEELLRAASGQFATGDYRAAVEGARSVVRMRPEAGAAHRLLGAALYELGRFDDSIEPLSRAIDLGEEVELSTKHRHGGAGLREGFCSGTVALSKNAITYRSQDQPSHGFSVPPDGMNDVTVTESYRRNATRVNTRVQAGDRGQRKRNFDFMHRETQRMRNEENSLLFVLTCRYCDASLNVQLVLMNYVSQLAR